MTEKIIQKAEDSDLEERERIKSIRLLGFSNHPQVLEVMRTALRPEASSSIQRAAIQAIVTMGSEEGGKLLTEPEIWKRFTLKVRYSIVSSMVSHPVFIPILLDAIAVVLIAT